jgi:hypothetical protein
MIKSYNVAPGGLKLRSSCLNLLSAGIIGMRRHAWVNPVMSLWEKWLCCSSCDYDWG